MWVNFQRKLIYSGRTAVAVLTLLTAGCSKPEEVIATRVALANQNLANGETDEAIEVLENLDARFPEEPVVLETLGFAYAQGGRHGMAAASFVKAADADPASGSLRQLAAEAFFQAGLIESAAEQHRLYLSEFPGDFQSWEKLGRIEERRGDLVGAIDAYLEWYRIRPNGKAAFALGTAFRRLNNSPQAGAWFEATIKHGETNIDDALFGLLELEIEAGDMAAAEDTVGQLDRNFPGTLDASPLAAVRGRIAAWKESQAALDQTRREQERMASELEEMRRKEQAAMEETKPGGGFTPLQEPPPPPEKPKAFEAPIPLADQTEVDESLAHVPAVEEEPTIERPPPAADLVAAIELRESGDMEAAIDALWRAIDKDDSRVELWLELADCHRATDEIKAAEAYALEARRRAPDSLEVETAYLNIVREARPPEFYLARVQAARVKFPANANLAYVFARELAAMEGDAVRTVAAFEDFLLLADPEDPRRPEAAEYLAQARRR